MKQATIVGLLLAAGFCGAVAGPGTVSTLDPKSGSLTLPSDL